jgi:PAS domain S-box-containing protein
VNDPLIKYSQLTNIFDFFTMGVMILSLDRKIISFNSTAELITGYKNAEVIGRYCYEVFLDTICGGTCLHKNASHVDLHRNKSAHEKERLVNHSHEITRIIAPLSAPDKKCCGYIEVFQDQSALIDLIDRIRHDDRRLKLILDNLDIGILTVDCGGHITFFNTMSETITGFKREMVLGKSCALIFSTTSGKEISMLNTTIADGNAHTSQEGEIKTRLGQMIPIRANYMALKNEDERIFGGLVTISDLSLIYQFNNVIKDRYTFYDMVGRDPAMQKIFEILPVVASSSATVLIEGLTGTGKDVLAKIIHHASPRSKKPMVKVNCAALPDNLLESELFGYVKGAFTGAEKDKPGRFQEADNGTIFLDEIGDLPLTLQAKLLRVLEDKEFYPLGSRKTAKVDVRIISATNQNLEQLVHEKRFRNDLYYRLNVLRFEMPPLKDRKGDIPLLISHIMKRLCLIRETSVENISEEAMEVLLNHDFPGNVRELENIIEHALIVCKDNVIKRKHLPISLQNTTHPAQRENKASSLDREMTATERTIIRDMLKKHGWNRKKTAQALNINRTTLWRKMKAYNITN